MNICPTEYPAMKYATIGRQQGIALITAVLITALVSIIAVTMISEQQLDIRRTGNVLDRVQALQFALGMETIALVALRKDAENGEVDHRMEDWNKPVQFPAPEGAEGDTITGRLEDMQGRFNLNNLVDNNGKIDPDRLRQFKKLLEHLGISPDLAERVADWIDADSTPQGMGGAEDGEYSRLEPSYRTANSFLVSPTELLLIMPAEEYGKLERFIAVLPRRETKININTASQEVLLSLDFMTSTDIAELMQQREQLEKQNNSGFAKIDDVLALPAFVALVNNEPEFRQYFERNCSVESEFFLANIHARFGKGEVALRSLIQRTKPQGQSKYKVYSVLRTQGDY